MELLKTWPASVFLTSSFSNKTGLNLDDNCNSSLFNIHVRTSECNFQVTFILPNFHKQKSKE